MADLFQADKKFPHKTLKPEHKTSFKVVKEHH